jgi:mannose/cellobiose epimerase-like protein (N-acyl-D-glucosamine 2-epimerase family)
VSEPWLQHVGLSWLGALKNEPNLPPVTQSRLGYCWSHLAHLFPNRVEFARSADKSFRSQPPVDADFRVYDHSFYLLFMAWYFRLTADPAAIDLFRQRYSLIEQHLDNAGVGGFGPQPVGIRSHNPYMHVLEALLAAFRHTQDDYWLNEALKIESIFFGRLLDRESGLVFECLNPDWTPTDERRIEFGHQFEWPTLLLELHAITGKPELLTTAERMQRFAMRHGIEGGLAINTPTDKSRLLWVQTEAVRRGAVTWDAIRRHFFHPNGWSWYNRLAADGTPIEEPSNPRLLYHIITAGGAGSSGRPAFLSGTVTKI